MKIRIITNQIFCQYKFFFWGLVLILMMSNQINAHGFIVHSRSQYCTPSSGLNTDCGTVENLPGYILNSDGQFPVSGPIDGKLASAGIPDFSELDEQITTRWSKQDISSEEIEFLWGFNVIHTTTNFKYYLTKPSWNPNQPLTRNSFNLTPFCQVNLNDTVPPSPTIHTCQIPTGYSGYHIIYAVWNTAGGDLGFYQVMDVNISEISDLIFNHGFE